MANAKSYPASLPRPLLSSSSIQIEQGYANSTMASGLMRSRPLYGSAIGRQTVQVVCEQYAAARLYAFLNDLGGAAFDMELGTLSDPETSIGVVSARWLGKLEQAQSIRADLKICLFEVFIERLDPLYNEESGVWDFFDQSIDLDEYTQIFENAVEGIPSA